MELVGVTIVIPEAVTVPLVCVKVQLSRLGLLKLLFTVIWPATSSAAIVDVKIVVLLPVGATVVPTVKDPQTNVPVPVIVRATFAVALLFKVTAPVTVKVVPVIVKVPDTPVKVREVNALAGVTVSIGCLVVTGIETTSPEADPGFPFGVQFVAVAHAVLVFPVQT